MTPLNAVHAVLMSFRFQQLLHAFLSAELVNSDKVVSSPESKKVSSLAEGGAYELSVAWPDTFINLERL